MSKAILAVTKLNIQTPYWLSESKKFSVLFSDFSKIRWSVIGF
jgi:hypothetical protein